MLKLHCLWVFRSHDFWDYRMIMFFSTFSYYWIAICLYQFTLIFILMCTLAYQQYRDMHSLCPDDYFLFCFAFIVSFVQYYYSYPSYLFILQSRMHWDCRLLYIHKQVESLQAASVGAFAFVFLRSRIYKIFCAIYINLNRLGFFEVILSSRNIFELHTIYHIYVIDYKYCACTFFWDKLHMLRKIYSWITVNILDVWSLTFMCTDVVQVT